MAELTPKEKLQPSLLDRLTDDEPEKRQESRDKRVLSPSRLRESVRRDLSWLFNTVNLAATQDLQDYPEVERSTLNFGLPDLAGRTASSIDKLTLERLLRRAVWDFEPRLTRQAVSVKLIVDNERMSHNAMCFTIEAELWAQPLPLRLFLRTELDLETGEVSVAEVTTGDEP
ncbi:MAG TPA: type VI secretion system baseplate subunit TssE [Polyangiaceae bacterium]|nr:type VI secretion system baseplate subunit TssE [Polyangiaceae bacterium]